MPSRPAGNSGPVRAGIYCRISLAAMGDTTKVDDQEQICRQLADRLGWHVEDVYQDHARSAWQPNRKRKEWDRMLADIESGRISAIVVYHGDRLLRTHEDLLTLIRLARTRGIQLASPAGTRDLGSYDDQFILEIEASMAKRESANTSRRRKAQYERWRREGRVRPGGRGGRPICFGTDGTTHVPQEAEWAREAAHRILDGESTGSVARDLAGRGWVTPPGAPMSAQTLKKMLLRPRMAGLMPDGESRGAWEPVIDRETWERVCLVLSAKAGEFGYATSARKWLLSGIAVCGAPGCGRPLQISMSQGRGRKEYAAGYACRDGCKKVYRSAVHLDAYVGGQVVAYLNNPLHPEGRAMPVDHAAEWRVLEGEHAATLAKLRDFRSSAGTLDALAARLEGIDARMAELRELAAGNSRARLIERYRGLTRGEWENGLALEVKRALVAACFTVTVLPASGRGPGFRVQDVRVEPLG